MKEFKKVIDEYLEKYIEYLISIVKSHYCRIIDESFAKFKELSENIKSDLLEDILESNLERFRFVIYELIKSENDGAFTINDHYFEEIVTKMLDYIDEYENNTEDTSTNSKSMNYSIDEENTTVILDIEVNNKILFGKHIIKNVKSNKNCNKVMISCFSYWKVLSKRFIDYFSKLAISKFVKYFDEEFSNDIEKKYTPYKDTGLRLIFEEKSIQIQRKKNQKSLDNFKKALEEIKNIK